jgi:hypothetical protein
MSAMRDNRETNIVQLGTDGLMTIRRDAHVETAVQYLVWALEEIEKAGNQKALRYARSALEALRESTPDTAFYSSSPGNGS